MKIFISYSRKDEVWKDKLLRHLSPLLRSGELDAWEDSQITVGTEWFPAIEKAINEADAAILLISSDFLSSKFIQEQEVRKLLKRREQEKMLIYPLLIESCLWTRVDWLSNIQIWPRSGKPLKGLNTDHDTDNSLVEFIKAVYAAFDKKSINGATGPEFKSEPVQTEKEIPRSNVPIESKKKRKDKEVSEPDPLDMNSLRNRLLRMVFFGMLGGMLFTLFFGGIFKQALTERFNLNLKHAILFNSFIWAVIGAFYADDEEYNVFIITGASLGLFAWFGLDGVITGFDNNFFVRALLFGPGVGAFLGILVKWVLNKKIWRPVISGLMFLLLSAIIYFTLFDNADDVHPLSVWGGDWVHRETWNNKAFKISDGTMTLKLKKTDTGDSPTIEGKAYNMLHQESSIIGASKNGGQTLTGKWENKETGKTGTFEWQYIPPASFRGNYTINGNKSKYSWQGNKFTSGFEYELSDEIVAKTGLLNLRTIFLSLNTLSRIRNNKDLEQEVNNSTIIKALKKDDVLHILDTIESNVDQIEKWYKVLTRVDNVLRTGYISARFEGLSTIKLKQKK